MFVASAFLPIAVFSAPVVAVAALNPTAVLLLDVVFHANAPYPIATDAAAVVIAFAA